ncbi:MAG TPA: hypothetical protein VFI51_04830 [Bradyrhizobium sp.]|nr:hypothetical protein [Bradyrhizobium sp.]
MRTMTMLALAATVTTVAVPAAAYYLTGHSDDPLGDTLRNYGYVPINPPSNLMNVGSLYYVDSRVKDFRAICNAEQDDLKGSVVSSPSWEMQETLERNGRFATGVKVDVGWLLKGGLDKNYVMKVHSTLTDVRLEEIPLGSNWLIFAKLMEKPQCSQVAMRYIRAGGYVCQGQKILHATAEFKLDRDAQSKLAASSKVTADNIKDIVKLAVESQSEQAVVEKDGRLFAGTALEYGVSMNPICLAPPDGRFQRILPQTALGRVANFVLFNIVEPILPAKPDSVEVAQAGHLAEGPK